MLDQTIVSFCESLLGNENGLSVRNQALVTAYPEGCKTRRQLMKENKEMKEKCRPEYPLDIFETGRRAEGFTKDPDAESE